MSATPAKRGSLDQRYRVRSLERALGLLEALAQGGRAGLSVSEIARRSTMSKSNSYSILQTLMARGYVADEGEGLARRYRLTAAFAQLAAGTLATDSLTTAGQRILESLTDQTGLTSRLGVLDDGYVVALLRVDGPGPVQLSTYLGRRELPHCSSVGKAIMATLPEAAVEAIVRRIGLPRRTPRTITTATALMRQLKNVSRQGYAIDDEEDHAGVFCVGAAFYDGGETAAGAISVSGLKPGRDNADLHRLGEIVCAHAARLSRALAR